MSPEGQAPIDFRMTGAMMTDRFVSVRKRRRQRSSVGQSS